MIPQCHLLPLAHVFLLCLGVQEITGSLSPKDMENLFLGSPPDFVFSFVGVVSAVCGEQHVFNLGERLP